MQKLGSLFAGIPSTSQGLQAALATKLKFNTFLISYNSAAYKALRILRPCYETDLYLRVKYTF